MQCEQTRGARTKGVKPSCIEEEDHTIGTKEQRKRE